MNELPSFDHIKDPEARSALDMMKLMIQSQQSTIEQLVSKIDEFNAAIARFKAREDADDRVGAKDKEGASVRGRAAKEGSGDSQTQDQSGKEERVAGRSGGA